jgi:hypothetical protein
VFQGEEATGSRGTAAIAGETLLVAPRPEGVRVEPVGSLVGVNVRRGRSAVAARLVEPTEIKSHVITAAQRRGVTTDQHVMTWRVGGPSLGELRQ